MSEINVTSTKQKIIVDPASYSVSIIRANVSQSNGSSIHKSAGILAGNSTAETVTHGLNTRDIVVSVYKNSSPWQAIDVDWESITLNTIQIRYNPQLGTSYRWVVVG